MRSKIRPPHSRLLHWEIFANELREGSAPRKHQKHLTDRGLFSFHLIWLLRPTEREQTKTIEFSKFFFLLFSAPACFESTETLVGSLVRLREWENRKIFSHSFHSHQRREEKQHRVRNSARPTAAESGEEKISRLAKIKNEKSNEKKSRQRKNRIQFTLENSLNHRRKIYWVFHFFRAIWIIMVFH